MPKKASLTAPEEDLFLTLSEGYQLLRRTADTILQPLGLTLAEHNLLRIVENTPQITARDIQVRMHASAPSVAQLVRSLETKQMIRRLADKTDGRIQHIRLTPNGRRAVRKARQNIARHARDVFHPARMIQSAVDHLREVNSALSASLPSRS